MKRIMALTWVRIDVLLRNRIHWNSLTIKISRNHANGVRNESNGLSGSRRYIHRTYPHSKLSHWYRFRSKTVLFYVATVDFFFFIHFLFLISIFFSFTFFFEEIFIRLDLDDRSNWDASIRSLLPRFVNSEIVHKHIANVMQRAVFTVHFRFYYEQKFIPRMNLETVNSTMIKSPLQYIRRKRAPASHKVKVWKKQEKCLYGVSTSFRQQLSFFARLFLNIIHRFRSPTPFPTSFRVIYMLVFHSYVYEI